MAKWRKIGRGKGDRGEKGQFLDEGEFRMVNAPGGWSAVLMG